MKDFFDLAEIPLEEIDSLLAQAVAFERQESSDVLRGKVLALLFLNPSLRTLTSLQATMIRLGGGTFVISPEMSIHGLETRSGIVMDGTAAEHLREAVPVIASYADAIGIRAIAGQSDLADDLEDRSFKELQALCDIPVINLESSIRHPCQSLADWKTLDDFAISKRSGKLVFSWVYHPDALPLSVVGDSIHMAVARGMEVTVLRPEGFEIPHPLLDRAEQAGLHSGGSVRETDDQREALEGAQVLYAGSWSSTRCYGKRLEDEELRRQNSDWCVDETWFADENCRVMHALPVRRGVEIEDDILDGPRSIVVKQAQNRMFAQMAILSRLLDGSSS